VAVRSGHNTGQKAGPRQEQLQALRAILGDGGTDRPDLVARGQLRAINDAADGGLRQPNAPRKIELREQRLLRPHQGHQGWNELKHRENKCINMHYLQE
jgi:hypothetical protein